MKHLIIIILLVSSCTNERVINQKDYKTEKQCICNYHYVWVGSSIWFQDSCNKYNIGDTIK